MIAHTIHIQIYMCTRDPLNPAMPAGSGLPPRSAVREECECYLLALQTSGHPQRNPSLQTCCSLEVFSCVHAHIHVTADN